MVITDLHLETCAVVTLAQKQQVTIVSGRCVSQLLSALYVLKISVE